MAPSTDSQACPLVDQWHPVAPLEVVAGVSGERGPGPYQTRLMGRNIEISVGDSASQSRTFMARGSTDRESRALPVVQRHGFLWTSLGMPDSNVFEIPEAAEVDRRVIWGGSFEVSTSAPRVIENFLDMGHFPFVHDGYLGVLPHTEVVDYSTEITSGEVWARECRFFQPLAAASASDGQVSEYVYRVPHPSCVMLFKTCPEDESRQDVIALFVQPLDEVKVLVHNYLALVDSVSSTADLRRFQQAIFAQDRPILENQLPARLPLSPKAERSVRADRSSSAYRRWLRETGVQYGVLPS